VSPLLSAGALASVRSALGILLTHVYTRTPITAGAEDSEGNAAPTLGAPVTGVACRYETVTRAVSDAGGPSVVNIPTLAVAATDPLAVGDRVSDITGSDGVVLLAGPLRLERLFDDTAGLGAMLQPVYELRGATVGGT
jgi:hypothetical protein